MLVVGSEFSRQQQQQQQQQQGGLAAAGGRKGTRDNVVRCVLMPPAPTHAATHTSTHAPAPAPGEVRAGGGLPDLALDDPQLVETCV